MTLPRNRAVDRVNLHYGLQAFADGLGGIFVLAYLLRAGVSLTATLVVFAVLLGGRFVMRPAVLPFARRWGLRPALIAGSLLTAASFPILTLVHGIGPALAAFCLVSSFGGVFYWTCFHAYFAAVGDAQDRGRQIGVREALATALGIIAPAVGGWALATAGARWTFSAVGLTHALAALPLIGAPKVAIAPAAPGALRAARVGLLIYLADGPFAAGNFYLWQIALFLSLGESFSAYGGAVALAALIGAGCGIVLGRHVDARHGRRAVFVAYALSAAVIVFRALSVGSPLLAVTANAAGAVSNALVMPAMMTAVYNLAKASPCPLRFNIVTEGARDVSCGAAFLAAAVLVWAGAPISLTILMALPATAALAAVLRRCYEPL